MAHSCPEMNEQNRFHDVRGDRVAWAQENTALLETIGSYLNSHTAGCLIDSMGRKLGCCYASHPWRHTNRKDFGHMSRRHLRKPCSYAQLTCIPNIWTGLWSCSLRGLSTSTVVSIHFTSDSGLLTPRSAVPRMVSQAPLLLASGDIWPMGGSGKRWEDGS